MERVDRDALIKEIRELANLYPYVGIFVPLVELDFLSNVALQALRSKLRDRIRRSLGISR